MICVYHGLGSYTYEKWYKEVFSPFEAGLHSGEVGGPEVGPAFAKVINTTILRGRNPEAEGGETVAVFMIVPNENGDPAAKGAREAIQKFFVDTGPGANPFWQEGRDAGWVGTDLTQLTYNLNFFRGANPKTGYPDDWKKGSGVGLYTVGLKIPYEEWVPQFTSPESDQLHDAAGIYSDIVGPQVKGSEFTSKYRGITVAHVHKNLKQAQAFADKFNAADSPPFDQIKDLDTDKLLEAHQAGDKWYIARCNQLEAVVVRHNPTMQPVLPAELDESLHNFREMDVVGALLPQPVSPEGINPAMVA